MVSAGDAESLFHYAFDLTIDLPATADVAAFAALPPLPPAKLRLRGRDSEGAALVEDITLTVGKTEITGGLTLRTGGPRPELAGALHAAHIEVAELLPAQPTVGTGPVFIANQYADLVGQSLLTVLLPTWGEEPGLDVFCAVVQMNVTEGKAATDGFVIDAERVTVGGGGGVDLATEELDVLIVPEAKRASIVPLVAPVHVGGTLAAPTIVPDAADLIISAPTSIAFGLIQPWDLVIPLVVRDDGGGMQPCIDALENPQQSRSIFQKTGDVVTDTVGAVGGAVSESAEGVGGLIKGLFGQ